MQEQDLIKNSVCAGKTDDLAKHEKILQMIEQVKPDDTAMLDEIDARVWCFVNKAELIEYPKTLKKRNDEGVNIYRNLLRARTKRYPEGFTEYLVYYTRSRDALKAIRPDGWWVAIVDQETAYIYKEDKDLHFASYIPNGTEELAELHAILKAIAYERGKENE